MTIKISRGCIGSQVTIVRKLINSLIDICKPYTPIYVEYNGSYYKVKEIRGYVDATVFIINDEDKEEVEYGN